MIKRKPTIAVVPYGISRGCAGRLVGLLSRPGVGDDANLVLICDRQTVVRGQIEAGQALQLEAISAINSGHEALGIAHLETAILTRRNPLNEEEAPDLAASMINALVHAMRMAQEGVVDGLVLLGDPSFPGDHLAAMPQGLLRWLAVNWPGTDEDDRPTIGEIVCADGFWHLSILDPAAVVDVPSMLNEGLIAKALELLAQAMAQAGFTDPNLAVASLNPRRSGGRFAGSEEAAFIAPPVQAATESGHRIVGPWPVDELVSEAREGRIDGLVTLHTGQARVVRAALSTRGAAQFIAGMPVPITRPLWEMPAIPAQYSSMASVDDHIDEAVAALNLARLLCSGARANFRFRGENRIGSPARR